MSEATTIDPGLGHVTAAETRLSRVDGEAGQLIIAGYRLEDIAPNASFEEMLHLLWHDRLPNTSELSAFREGLAALRHLPDVTLDVLKAAAAEKLDLMDTLRMGTATLSLGLSDWIDPALRVVAAMPSIVAASWRMQNGDQPISPDSSLSHAANYLYMLTGNIPDDETVRALETYLNTVVDHGLNASTFSARVVISTRSDMISAVTAAIGALKGPLHGGAPGPALDMVFEIAQPENAERVIREKLANGERIMGFGHRVYRVRDPRADVLNDAAKRFFSDEGDRDLYNLARHVESVALDVLSEHRPERRLQTNVEYYTALLLHGIGLPTELFTPTFAIGRVGGWTAHAREQLATGRIVRPRSAYSGDLDRAWLSIIERS
jgi:citrate synthase